MRRWDAGERDAPGRARVARRGDGTSSRDRFATLVEVFRRLTQGLPAGGPESDASAGAPIALPAASAPLEIPSGARILLTGADAAQETVVRRALEADGYQVTWCESARETVVALRERPADLLLLGAPLPDAPVAPLLRWARSRPASAHMTCMVMLAPGDPQAVADLYDAGADFVITRHTEFDLLSRKVAAALRGRPGGLASQPRGDGALARDGGVPRAAAPRAAAPPDSPGTVS